MLYGTIKLRNLIGFVFYSVPLAMKQRVVFNYSIVVFLFWLAVHLDNMSIVLLLQIFSESQKKGYTLFNKIVRQLISAVLPT